MTRVLAIDLGRRRSGLALSDPTRAVAVPLDTIAHQSRRQALATIAGLARTHEVGHIVVGWPRNMDGTSGPAAREAEAFAGALSRVVEVPVDLWDERLSTVAADRSLRDAGVGRGRRRDLRDRVAAALILQSYLAARPWERSSGSRKEPADGGTDGQQGAGRDGRAPRRLLRP